MASIKSQKDNDIPLEGKENRRPLPCPCFKTPVKTLSILGRRSRALFRAEWDSARRASTWPTQESGFAPAPKAESRRLPAGKAAKIFVAKAPPASL
jgi:hypothetical protein